MSQTRAGTEELAGTNLKESSTAFARENGEDIDVKLVRVVSFDILT